MELRGFGKSLNINNLSVEQAKEMKEEIDREGMKVASIGSGYGKINIKEDFAPHFEAFKNTVAVAKTLEAKYIRIFSFYFSEGDSYEEYRDEVIRRVKAMTDYAVLEGLICCHKNEKGIYGDNAERCLDILKACEGKLKAVFDPANFVQCGVDTQEAWSLLNPYVKYLHAKDADKNGKVVPCGMGIGNVPYIFGEFAKMGGGVITLEPHLKSFVGLSALEGGDTSAVGGMSFASSDEAFDYAVNAAKNIAEKL